MQDYTCITCRQSFTSLDEQRDHFKTLLHVENCRRSQKALPPMTPDEYIEFLTIQQQETAELAAKQALECTICNRKFKSNAQMIEHMTTNKHKQRIKLIALKTEKTGTKKIAGTGDQCCNDEGVNKQNIDEFEFTVPSFCNYEEAEIFRQILPQLLELDEQAQDELIFSEIVEKRTKIGCNECLMCEKTETDFTTLEKHMEEEHGFFVPYRKYCDAEKLIDLFRTVYSQTRQCFKCEKSFFSISGLRRHLAATFHILPDIEKYHLMFPDYYDFTSTYPIEMLKELEAFPEQLKQLRCRPFRLERGDIQTSFQLNLGGKYYSLKEWSAYRKIVVPEWAKVRLQQKLLLDSLRKLGYRAIENQSYPENVEKTTNIQLTSQAQNIVSQINDLAKQTKSQSKYILRITDEWMQKEMECQRLQLQPEELIGAQDNRNFVYTEQNESINQFKPHFKRSTLHIYN
ncbi:Zinc finger domain-containing protein [Spironucleus salmonicida]|uniref:Zinc finger domain-containing protein n=1 Tax=Spironucleus salmonicida TaxID=348837 RepID=V6LBZ2_9EUKA|nr:Zinc finger domain-containing protein [Spironucleus salmonicida]|eukprot:EST42020.1 Zinc finger domain-containing protein [Spironucleus salmonicida]